MIYFDHAATTPLLDEVHTLVCKSLKDDFANPSSKHKLGTELQKKIEKSRKNILNLLGASGYELIFTSSATESNNQVIKTFSDLGKTIYCLSDHPSISNALSIEDEFLLESEDLIESVNEETELVVITLVNSQAGTIKNVNEIASVIKMKSPETKILVDAVQGVGKIPFSLEKSAIDYISIAAHKIGGPRGVAALIFKKDLPLKILLDGGGHELGLRSSTPATSLILGFELALEIAISNLDENFSKIQKLNIKLRNSFEKLHKNIQFPFSIEESSPYILCMIFKGIPSDVLLRHLESKDVYISSTTACSSKIKGKNPMFVGLGIDEKLHKNVMRISFASTTTEEEVDLLLEKFKEVIKQVSFLIK
ncbi:MAG: hypothetical protein BM556_15795 [Bacteriovorax sp. MedPE-SWde]|nr:MAG: hypothetical protein BM556_15795 [Bacteriovorax sp. MedPE-SWde]